MTYKGIASLILVFVILQTPLMFALNEHQNSVLMATIEIGTMYPAKEDAFKWIDKYMDEIWGVALKIWEYAEVALQEFKSSELLASTLEKYGFTVERGVAGLPTAFVATWGSGKPVIGFTAEFDALPGLSNITAGAPGHACGHNLFGTAAVYAAIALKEVMSKYGISGTIKVFGTPAEEILVGKTIMVAAGVFNGTDVVLDWHPGSSYSAAYTSTVALDNKIYRFYGVTAHAGASPWLGKSALDAALLFAMGIEFIREHMWEKDRIHYIIAKGGEAPNIVPDYAEVRVFIRSYDMKHWEELSQWVDAAAIGAALATRTKVEIERVIGVHILLPNKVLNEVIHKNALIIGLPKWSPEDYEYVKTQLSQPYTKLPDTVAPFSGWEVGASWVGGTGSTDVAEISWNIPVGRFTGPTWAVGTPSHHIDATEQSASSIAYKGLNVAVKTLAASALDIILNANTVIPKAWEELKARKESLGWTYKPYLPAIIKYPEYVLSANITIKQLEVSAQPTTNIEQKIADINSTIMSILESMTVIREESEQISRSLSNTSQELENVKTSLKEFSSDIKGVYSEIQEVSRSVESVKDSMYTIAVTSLIGGTVLGVGLASIAILLRKKR